MVSNELLNIINLLTRTENYELFIVNVQIDSLNIAFVSFIST